MNYGDSKRNIKSTFITMLQPAQLRCGFSARHCRLAGG